MRFSGALLLIITVSCSAPPPAVVPVARPQVLPASVSFGRVLRDETRRLTVRNVGDEGSVLGVQVTPLGPSSHFTFVVSGETAPVTIDITALATAAGVHEAMLEVVTSVGAVDVPLRSEVVTNEGCELQVSPSRLDFGVVNGSASLDVTLRAAGPGACVVEAPVFEGSALFRTFSRFPLAVLPGQSERLPVVTSPMAGLAGAQSGTLRIGTHEVALSATVVQPCVVITPDDFHFGTVKQSCEAPVRTFFAYNTCSLPATLKSLELFAGAEHFAFDATPAMPVAVGNPTLFSIRYRPTSTAAHLGAARLVVEQAGVTVEYVVTVRGSGEPAPHRDETWVVPPSTKVDLLVVLDDSPSMAAHRASVDTNLKRLASQLFGSGNDVKVGLTTAAPGATTTVVSSTMSGAEAALDAALANVGTSGSDTTQLFASAVAASSGFFRSGALPSVLTVSDADDRSPGAVNGYVGQLQSVSSRLSWFAVGPARQSAPAGCSYDGPGGQPRSHSLTQQLGGIEEDICDADWSRGVWLTPFSFGFRTVFFLSEIPAPGTLRVTAGGVALPASTGWTYDGQANAVILSPLSLPEPGDAVVISYDVKC